ncbi:MAG: T9SS type A sorting domain-containing protein [Sphingobacteriales bacterium]|nr:T9SS type A sorting domain-containing protein [Sphingobacteriales bacterium]
MIKNYFLVLLLLLTALIQQQNAWAQDRCSTMHHHELIKQKDPLYEQKRQEIEAFTESYSQKGGKADRAVVTIPVVVHVVYQNSTENISNAQVQSQIDVLNEDFRRLNADASSTPSAFTGIAADAEVEFCLATIDPSGNATDGITNTSTAVGTFSDNDAVKYTSSGGIDAWDPSSYLNIWVCDMGSSLLGYAQFPGGPSATDGVVIHYLYFGTTGTATSPFDKGRTTTHEVGHYLNLYHIWGDDGGACTGSDLVSDTPNQASEYYGCPAYPQTSCSSSDMFMNYMDYTDDACMNMFSAGQKTRMQALFASGGVRVSLLSSTACGAACTAAPAAPALSSPANAATNVALSPTLSWGAVTGTNAATSYEVQVSTSSTFATIYASYSGANTSYTVSPALAYSTTYYWRVRSVNSCGTGAWSTIRSFTTLACTAPAAPALSSPANAAINIALTPTLTWTAVSGATSYDVQVSTSNTFGSTVASGTGITGTSYTVGSSLSVGTIYYWRVRTINSCGTSAWSTVYSFTTTSSTCSDYITNGGFESGANVGWSESSSNGFQTVDNTSNVYNSGAWSAWLGGANNENSQVWQSITIPAGSTATLTYYYLIYTTTQTTCTGDVAYLKINGTTVTTYQLCTNTSMGNYAQATFDLTSYAGQTVEIRFQAITNASNISHFFVDDVVAEVCAPVCPTSLNYVNTTDDFVSGETFDFECSGVITANNIINSGANITYDCGAASYVSLTSGFWAKSGCFFEAFPDGCGGAKSLDVPADAVVVQGTTINTDMTTLAKSKPNYTANTNTAASKGLWVTSLQAYPNPTDGVINFTVNDAPQGFVLSISDIQGKTVHQWKQDEAASQATFNLPAGVLQSGIYIATLSMNNGTVAYQKIVVR